MSEAHAFYPRRIVVRMAATRLGASREHGRERLLALFSSSNRRLSPVDSALLLAGYLGWRVGGSNAWQRRRRGVHYSGVGDGSFFRVESGKKPALHHIRVFKVLPPTAASDAQAMLQQMLKNIPLLVRSRITIHKSNFLDVIPHRIELWHCSLPGLISFQFKPKHPNCSLQNSIAKINKL